MKTERGRGERNETRKGERERQNNIHTTNRKIQSKKKILVNSF